MAHVTETRAKLYLINVECYLIQMVQTKEHKLRGWDVDKTENCLWVPKCGFACQILFIDCIMESSKFIDQI
jgi:hypothetical protein